MLIIREAKIKDARRLSYLIRKNVEHVEENFYTSAQKAAWSAENKPKAIKERLLKRKTYCAFEHGKMVGTTALDENLVCGMYISYSKRNCGIGHKLMDHLEKYAYKKGIKELILTATKNGYGFYLKNGYKPYGKLTHTYHGSKFPEIKMKKNIEISSNYQAKR